MISFFKSLSKDISDLIRNTHFFIILAIIFALTYTYYIRYISQIPYYVDALRWFWYVEVFEFTHNMHGILFYIPIIYSLIIFRYRKTILIWVLCLFFILPYVIKYASYNIDVLTANLVYLIGPLFILFIINLEVEIRGKERAAIIENEKQQTSFITGIVRAQEDERQRIAQNLHDDIAQTLVVIANRANDLLSGKTEFGITQSMKEDLEWITEYVLRTSDDVRRLSLDLKPRILYELGFLPALKWILDNLKKDIGVDADMKICGSEREISHEIQIILFRFTQEAISNIRKHSKASRVNVTVEFTINSIKTTVEDNGIGFDIDETMNNISNVSKMGIMGMKEKAKSLGGIFNIQSVPGQGTCVSLDVNDPLGLRPASGGKREPAYPTL